MSEASTMSNRQSLKYELFGAWCAPIFSVLAFGAWFVLAHWYDPASAALPPEELKGWFAERKFEVILGMSIFCLATLFLTIYAVQLGIWLWRFEGRSPLMAISSMLGGFAVVIYVFVSNCLWIGVAYRSDDPTVDAHILVAINDAAWFAFLVGWVGLTQQMLCTSAITIRDKRKEPLVPHWITKAFIVGALLVPMANGCAFAMTGAFAWDGVLGYYVPIAIWGVWLDVHAWYMRKDIRRRMAEEKAGVDSTVAVPGPANSFPGGTAPAAG